MGLYLMTIEELELLIADVTAQLNTENDILGGLYNGISDQKATVDRLTAKLGRLHTAQAVLKGIEEDPE